MLPAGAQKYARCDVLPLTLVHGLPHDCFTWVVKSVCSYEGGVHCVTTVWQGRLSSLTVLAVHTTPGTLLSALCAVASACRATVQGASLDAAHDFADTNHTSSEHHAVSANTSTPTSPFGTPRGAPRHASLSHHVPPIAATVSAAAAALGLNSSSRPSHYHDGSGADQGEFP